MLLAAIVLTVFVWCFGVVKREVLGPLWSIVEKGYGWAVAYKIGQLLISFLILLLAAWLISGWASRRVNAHTNAFAKKTIQGLKGIRKDTEERIHKLDEVREIAEERIQQYESMRARCLECLQKLEDRERRQSEEKGKHG